MSIAAAAGLLIAFALFAPAAHAVTIHKMRVVENVEPREDGIVVTGSFDESDFAQPFATAIEYGGFREELAPEVFQEIRPGIFRYAGPRSGSGLRKAVFNTNRNTFRLRVKQIDLDLGPLPLLCLGSVASTKCLLVLPTRFRKGETGFVFSANGRRGMSLECDRTDSEQVQSALQGDQRFAVLVQRAVEVGFRTTLLTPLECRDPASQDGQSRWYILTLDPLEAGGLPGVLSIREGDHRSFFSFMPSPTTRTVLSDDFTFTFTLSESGGLLDVAVTADGIPLSADNNATSPTATAARLQIAPQPYPFAPGEVAPVRSEHCFLDIWDPCLMEHLWTDCLGTSQLTVREQLEDLFFVPPHPESPGFLPRILPILELLHIVGKQLEHENACDMDCVDRRWRECIESICGPLELDGQPCFPGIDRCRSSSQAAGVCYKRRCLFSICGCDPGGGGIGCDDSNGCTEDLCVEEEFAGPFFMPVGVCKHTVREPQCGDGLPCCFWDDCPPGRDCDTDIGCCEGCPAPGGFGAAQVVCPVCGNNITEGTEQCDDGNLINCDGCDSNCTASACGNGIVCPPEACDGTNDATCPGFCSGTCQCMPTGVAFEVVSDPYETSRAQNCRLEGQCFQPCYGCCGSDPVFTCPWVCDYCPPPGAFQSILLSMNCRAGAHYARFDCAGNKLFEDAPEFREFRSRDTSCGGCGAPTTPDLLCQGTMDDVTSAVTAAGYVGNIKKDMRTQAMIDAGCGTQDADGDEWPVPMDCDDSDPSVTSCRCGTFPTCGGACPAGLTCRSNCACGDPVCADDVDYPLGDWFGPCYLAGGNCLSELTWLTATSGIREGTPRTFTTSGPLVPGGNVTITVVEGSYTATNVCTVSADGCCMDCTWSDGLHSGTLQRCRGGVL